MNENIRLLSPAEMYWCPVNHARKVLDLHRRYAGFSDFGAGEDFEAHVAAVRDQVSGDA